MFKSYFWTIALLISEEVSGHVCSSARLCSVFNSRLHSMRQAICTGSQL